jgi:hypothetical protein
MFILDKSIRDWYLTIKLTLIKRSYSFAPKNNLLMNNLFNDIYYKFHKYKPRKIKVGVTQVNGGAIIGAM